MTFKTLEGAPVSRYAAPLGGALSPYLAHHLNFAYRVGSSGYRNENNRMRARMSTPKKLSRRLTYSLCGEVMDEYIEKKACCPDMFTLFYAEGVPVHINKRPVDQNKNLLVFVQPGHARAHQEKCLLSRSHTYLHCGEGMHEYIKKNVCCPDHFPSFSVPRACMSTSSKVLLSRSNTYIICTGWACTSTLGKIPLVQTAYLHHP